MDEFLDQHFKTFDDQQPINTSNHLTWYISKIKFRNDNTIELLVMIDLGNSKSYIDINLVATDCLQILPQPIFAEQIDGTGLKYDKCIRDLQISFYTVENAFDEYYPLPQA